MSDEVDNIYKRLAYALIRQKELQVRIARLKTMITVSDNPDKFSSPLVHLALTSTQDYELWDRLWVEELGTAHKKADEFLTKIWDNIQRDNENGTE